MERALADPEIISLSITVWTEIRKIITCLYNPESPRFVIIWGSKGSNKSYVHVNIMVGSSI